MISFVLISPEMLALGDKWKIASSVLMSDGMLREGKNCNTFHSLMQYKMHLNGLQLQGTAVKAVCVMETPRDRLGKRETGEITSTSISQGNKES